MNTFILLLLLFINFLIGKSIFLHHRIFLQLHNNNNNNNYLKNETYNTHLWSTIYGYNILECIDIKKFDENSVKMICSLF